MATNYFNGVISLGGTAGMFEAFARFGTLSPGWEYGMLHGALHAVLAELDQIPAADLKAVAEQSRAFRGEFAERLNEHELWILEQLGRAG